MTEEEKQVLNNNYENGMRKLSDEEIEGIAGGVVDGDLVQDEEDNDWY